MNSEDQVSKRRTLTDIAYQFVLGTAFGLVLIMLPAFFISLSTLEWQSSYLEVLGIVVVLCGFLSAILGKSFFKPLIQFLESIPTVF
jgi:cytochrome c biogenesis protein CcdA